MLTHLRGLQAPALLWLGLFLVSFNHIGMTSLIAPIVRDLGTTVANFQTILVLLALVTAAAIPSSTNVGEMYGQRRLIMTGLVLFIAAAAVGATSPAVLGVFVGFSILGGLAAAPLVTVPWALMETSYTGRKRDIALMALSTSISLAGALAPSVVGFISDAAGWRWAFAPQIVLAGVLLLLVRSVSAAPSKPREPIDWLAGGLALIGLAAALAGVTLADEYGWWEPRKLFLILGVWVQPFPLSIAPWLMMAGAVLLGLWVFERRTQFGKSRIQPFRFGPLTHRPFMAGMVTAAFHSLAIAGLMFALFVYVPFAFGLQSFGTAIAVLPFSLATLAATLLTSALARRIVPKYLLQGGLAVGSVGVVLLFNAVSHEGTIAGMLPGLILLGLGSGLVYEQIPRLTLSLPGPDASRETTGIYNSVQELGGSLGTALLGALLMVSAATYVVDGVTREVGVTLTSERRSEVIYQLSETWQTATPGTGTIAAQFPREVQAALATTARQAAVDAMRVTLLAICGSLVLALAASAFVPRGARSST